MIYSRNKANVSKTHLITFKKQGERFSLNRENDVDPQIAYPPGDWSAVWIQCVFNFPTI